MFQTFLFGTIFIASLILAKVIGFLDHVLNIFGLPQYAPSYPAYITVGLICYIVATFTDRAYDSADDGPRSYKHWGVDSTSNHPFFSLLLINLIICLLTLTAMGYITKASGKSYETTFVPEIYSPSSGQRHCKPCGGYVSGTAAGINRLYISGKRYDYLTDNRTLPVFISGHKGLLGKTVDRYVIEPRKNPKR